MERYIPTGNETVSLPKINAVTAGIEDITFLYMQQKGMIEIRGDDLPLILPFVEIDGKALPLENLKWKRKHAWLPSMEAKAGGLDYSMVILPPVGERGFAIKLSVTAPGQVTIAWGIHGCWDSSWHCVNENKQLEGSAYCYESNWNDGLIFDFRSGGPMFSFAPMSDKSCEASHKKEDNRIYYRLSRNDTLSAGESKELIFYWGFGFEEVAAATSAKEMLRRGWDWEYKKTAAWLDARSSKMTTDKLTDIYNTNLFFCIFFSTGITLDTEELVCATSRSTRYYVSAAYWDRDVLLWAFPAILDADKTLAEDILHYIFGRQRKNIGVHSRYIDGTVLEPGFELDELLAPIISLEAYISKTHDRGILADTDVKRGIEQILKVLGTVRHPEIPLYETFLQPTDDVIVHPYLVYNNVLVWKAFNILAKLMPKQYGHLAESADAVKSAIYRHCVFTDKNGNPYFAWSVDLNGGCNVYDEPPGSLQLLPYYGFCKMDDPVWNNTVDIIRSPAYEYSFAGYPIAEIGCAHAPYPWVLSLCNSLLCGHAKQALRELESMEMDNGIACESVDPVTGVCTTGAAFATCAGFLCHSLMLAGKEDTYAN